MKRPAFFILVCVSALSLCASAADLEEVKGDEADRVVRIVTDTLKLMKSFSLNITKEEKSDFFEPLVTKGDISWERPMRMRWIEINPENGKMESISVLNPEQYIHYIKDLNKVEILRIKGKKDIEEGFAEYMEILEGEYDRLTEKYTFLVFRDIDADPETEVGKDKTEEGKTSETGNSKLETGKGEKEGEKPLILKPDTENTRGRDEKKEPEKEKTGNTESEKEESRKDTESKTTIKEKDEKKKKEEAEIDPLTFWALSQTKFKTDYGKDLSQYRIKFKPKTEELKKQLVHISFYISRDRVISRIIMAKADGDITDISIDKLDHINKSFKKELFTFKIPPDAEIENLLED